jgi:hypothetical protein
VGVVEKRQELLLLVMLPLRTTLLSRITWMGPPHCAPDQVKHFYLKNIDTNVLFSEFPSKVHGMNEDLREISSSRMLVLLLYETVKVRLLITNVYVFHWSRASRLMA